MKIIGAVSYLYLYPGNIPEVKMVDLSPCAPVVVFRTAILNKVRRSQSGRDNQK
jgi:hypothetical protein